MFYIKNDDMEDMFKKAADEYELNEDMAADWNSVHAALQDDVKPAGTVKTEKKRRKFYLIWWLFAIGLISVTTYKAGVYFSNKKQNTKAIIIKKSNTDIQNNLAKEKNNINGNNVLKSLINTTIKKDTAINSNKKIVSSNPAFYADKKSHSSTNNKNADVKILNSFVDDATKASLNNKNFSQPLVTNKNNYIPAIINDSVIKKIANTNQLENKNNGTLNNKNAIAETNTSKQKKKSNNYTRQAFAYAGFIANADLSFIKFQQTSSPGYGLGIIGGYHFKNGISLETGILYDKKNYYTKGEYFDKSKLLYLQNVYLLSADGNCNMWEIPVNFKYDFNTQKKYNWFVAAGVSSYIMHKEFYNFKYKANGVIGERGYDYYHSSQNFFSVLNVSGGINIKTGNKYFLQVQPYYKIPLSGIGKGNLSLSSAGINVSITRRLR